MYQHVSRAHLAAAQLVHRHVVSPPWTAHLRGLCIALALMMMVHLAWFVHVDYGLPGDDAFFGKAGASPCRGDVDSATGLPRIVVVATLKPFSADPESKLRQLNAINSWRRSYPAARIFLEALYGIEVTPIATPILSSMISAVKREDSAQLIMFANGDVVFTPGIRAAVEAACSSFTTPFLLIGQRFEVPLKGQLPWEDKDDRAWTGQVRALEGSPEAYLKDVANKDYFIFPRTLWMEGLLPPLVVGRAEVDNYLVQDVVARGLPVLDITPAVRIYHVTHQYLHLAGGKTEAWQGAEARQNRFIMRARFGKGRRELSHVWHSTHVLRCRGSVERGEPDDPHCAADGKDVVVVARPGAALWRRLFLLGAFHFELVYIALAVYMGVVILLRVACQRHAPVTVIDVRRKA